jgi:hypothetical protein
VDQARWSALESSPLPADSRSFSRRQSVERGKVQRGGSFRMTKDPLVILSEAPDEPRRAAATLARSEGSTVRALESRSA